MPIDVGQLLGIIVRHVWREAVTILTGSARLGNGYCPRKQPIRTMTAETLLRSPFGPVHYALAIVVVELCAVDNVAARLPSQFPYSLCTLWSPNGCCTMLGPCCVLPVWGRARPCEYHAGSSRVPWGGGPGGHWGPRGPNDAGADAGRRALCGAVHSRERVGTREGATTYAGPTIPTENPLRALRGPEGSSREPWEGSNGSF